MPVQLITTRSDFDSLEPDWNRLWQSCASGDVFQHFAWSSAFVDAFELHDRVHVLAWKRDGRIAAILPLFFAEPGRLRKIGDPRSDYADILCAEQDTMPAMTAFLHYLQKTKACRVLEIRECSEKSRLYRQLCDTKKIGRPLNWQVASPCPGIDLTSGEAEFAKLVRKKSLVRHERAMAKRGPLKLRVCQSWPEMEPLLDEMFSQHVARWNAAGQNSIYEHERERQFCRMYSARLLDANLLHFSLLYSCEEIMAIHLGFLSDGVFTWYKPTFSLQHTKLSPGEVIIKKLLEHCATSNVAYFDFTRGDEHFKLRFSSEIRQNHTMIVFSRRRDQFLFRVKNILRSVLERLVRVWRDNVKRVAGTGDEVRR